jgi:Arm DNA-binding domain
VGIVSRVKFTAQSVRAIRPPAEGRLEVFDAALTGFGIRVSASGKRSWFLLFRFEGRLRRWTIGSADSHGLTLSEARQKAREGLHAIAMGIDPSAEKLRIRRAATFADVAAKYVESRIREKRGVARAQEILTRDILPAIGHLKAARVTRSDIREMLRPIVDRGSPVAANRTLGVISRIFNFALREEIGDVVLNPCSRMLPPGGRETPRERVLSDAEIIGFWNLKNITPVMHTALKLILVTGQRPGEILGLEWTGFGGRSLAAGQRAAARIGCRSRGLPRSSWTACRGHHSSCSRHP